MGSTTSKSSSDSDTSRPMNNAVKTWNVAAGATVLLPLLVLMFASIFSGEGGGGGGGGEGGFWNWSWFRNEGAQEENGGPLVFVYLWSLVLFGVLVWFGNRVLGGEAGGGKEKSVQNLFVALVGFANLAFLCLILMQSQVRIIPFMLTFIFCLVLLPLIFSR